MKTSPTWCFPWNGEILPTASFDMRNTIDMTFFYDRLQLTWCWKNFTNMIFFWLKTSPIWCFSMKNFSDVKFVYEKVHQSLILHHYVFLWKKISFSMKTLPIWSFCRNQTEIILRKTTPTRTFSMKNFTSMWKSSPTRIFSIVNFTNMKRTEDFLHQYEDFLFCSHFYRSELLSRPSF